jgi:hypothetical protein
LRLCAIYWEQDVHGRIRHLLREGRLGLICAGIAAACAGAGIATAASGGTSSDVINGCVRKADGVLRVLPAAKAGKKSPRCGKRETAISWNKQGPAGAAGAAGPAGSAASSDTLDQLHSQIQTQADQIAALEDQLGQLAGIQGQVAQLTGQATALAAGLGTVTGQLSTFQTTACNQLTGLTAQSNALGTALDGVGLGGTIPPALTLVTPPAPPALPAFAC